MGIYRGLAPLKAYKGDMQPVNVYKGSTKVAGWHSASYSGTSPLTVDCDYNVPPDALVIDGKCQQSTTTGKNLFDSKVPLSIIDCTVIEDDGYITATAKTSGTYRYAQIAISGFAIGKNYVLSGNVENTGSSGRINIMTSETMGVVTWIDSDTQSAVWECSQETYYFRFSIASSVPTEAGTYIRARVQIELGSAATAYEPYTGGIPSPNPDYPQPITTITGDLTITAANGDLSDTVVTPLDSVELCSLPDGTKDSYDAVTGVVTKRVGKVVFDGSAVVDMNNSTNPGVTQFAFRDIVQSVALSQAMCNRFWCITDYSPTQGTFRMAATSVVLNIANATIGVLDSDTDAVKVTAFKSWLAANPVTVYYKLAIPTTVQLTPHLPVVRTGIKTLSVGADVMPTISATVTSMD